MKRLSPAKRNLLFMVILGTVGLIAVVYLILIQPQNDKINELARKIGTETGRLQQMKTEITQMSAITSTLADAEQQLNHAEEDVVSGDVYAWTYDTLRRFKSSYRVDIPNLSQPAAGDVDLIAGFPYKQVKFSVNGTAFYHDLGKFVADLENKFPHIRLNNLVVEPASVPGGPPERLSFRMDIIALTRPTP